MLSDSECDRIEVLRLQKIHPWKGGLVLGITSLTVISNILTGREIFGDHTA